MSKVLIAVPTAEFARQARFYDHLALLDKPEGTIMSYAHGQSPARNRNMMIAQAQEQNCTHIFFVDDDLVMPTDTLTKLLEHDLDVVSGLYLMRSVPHQPIAFENVQPDGRCIHLYLNEDDGTTKEGVVPMVASGLGVLLVKMHIFDRLEKPYIRMGELEPDMWCDDLGFFQRLRQSGFTEFYCDLNVRVGHMATSVIWPARSPEGKWGASIVL